MSTETSDAPAEQETPSPPPPKGRIGAARRRIPENVRTLGLVSLANDAASELAYPIIPLFVVVTLGAPTVVVGLIEGIAEAMALSFRLMSGWLSDRIGGRRKRPWISTGYTLSTAARVVIAAAPVWGWVLAGKIVDRVGKGTRGTPRDALIRESTPRELLGSSFGYHRMMDTIGAVIGPLIAFALLALGLSLRTILWVGVIPGFFTLLLLRRIREAPTTLPVKERPAPLKTGSLPASFWAVLQIWFVFSLGNSSDAFLLLRARDLGLATLLVVLAYAIYNFVYSAFSWPLGALSDRIPRAWVVTGGIVVFGLVYAGFAIAPGSWAVWPLFAIYGIYVAATEGVGRAWVADHVPTESVGTAYGVFYAAAAAAALLSSILAGVLWTYVSPKAPFVFGAVTAAVSVALLGAYALRNRFGTRVATALLASLAAAVIVVGTIDHQRVSTFASSLAQGKLKDFFGHVGEAELPAGAVAHCPAETKERASPFLPAHFPTPPGAVYTASEKPLPIMIGFWRGDLQSGYTAYQNALISAGYTVVRSQLDPTDAEVDFQGANVLGQVTLIQACTDRSDLRIAYSPESGYSGSG